MSEDTPEALMQATYRALCEHGFADLTMQDIADESDKSKATLHYHFDSKRDLLRSFLDYLYDDFAARLAAVERDDPAARLHALVDTVLDHADEETGREFKRAFLEILTQAPHRPGYEERMKRFDETLHDHLVRTISDGIDDGTFDDDVDPEFVAEFIVTYVNGAQARCIGSGESLSEMRRTLHRYVETTVVETGVTAE